MTKTPYRFELYRDRKREWRWRLVHRNGRIVAESGEGYRRKFDCNYAINSVLSLSEAEITTVEKPTRSSSVKPLRRRKKP